MCERTASLFLTFVILTSFFIILQTTAAETPEVLVQGAPIHGTNGIMFDSNDRLHIASVVGREIVVMDPETGEILDRLGTDLGIEGPDDLTFGPDGSLYWTSILTGEVGRLSPDGVKTGQMVMPGVNPITFSDDGRLFVALDFLGDGLYELDPDLVEPPRLIIETLGFLNAFDFGPDGFLYGPIWTMGQVVRIDVDTAELTPVVDDIGIPAAVKFDSQGRLHVLDHLRGEVLRVDTETGSKEVIAQLPPGGDNLAFDSQDRLFVSHAGDGSIFEVLPDGTTRTVSPGGIIVSGGVAVMARPEGDESVFVADLFTLREFDGLTGEERGIEHSLLTVPGSIISTFTVSPDGGNLVLSSWFANAVQVWNPETHEPLEIHEDFVVPLNAIRFQGDLVVAELGQEAGAARVVRASAADPAERVTLIDATGGLVVPAGLAATDDDLWVGDWATGMVLQLVADGELLAEPVPVAMNLAFPEGITVAPDGNLLVVETGAGRLSRINLANGEVSTMAEGLAVGFPGIPGYPPTWILSGVTVGPSGTIYITSDINNQLLAIPPMEPPVVEEGPLAGIHTSISSGIVTDPGETKQVIKDGVMHIISDGFEYEMQIESTWDNGEKTVSSMKVRGYMDLVPISETEAVGKGYSTTEQYSPDGELVFIGSAESDDTVNLVTGESSSTYYIYASGLGEYAGYSHITIGDTRVWIDEDGTQRVEATGHCIVSKIEHDFTIASASLAAMEAEAPLTGLHTSELSGIVTNPGEVEQVMVNGVPHIITRGIEYEMQIDTTWDTGEVGIGSLKAYSNMDLVPISQTEAVGKSYFTLIDYDENGEPAWSVSGESDERVDLVTGESRSKVYAIGTGHGRYAGYTHISIFDFGSWVDDDGISRAGGTGRCLVMKVTQDMSEAYFVEVQPGLNMISVPLNSLVPHTARSLAEKLSATVVIEYNEAEGRFVGFTLDAPGNGFDILGGKGYIVNVPKGGVVGFTGTGWSNQPPAMAAPPVSSGAWAFVVSGSVLDGDMMSASDGGYTVTVKNLRTGAVATETVGESGYFAAAYADLSRKAVVEAGDKMEVAVIDSRGKVASGPFVHDVTLDSIRDAVVKVQLRLGDIIPEKSALLQNYPNPFNPETWIPFHLKGEASVSIRIFNLSGQLVKTLDLGNRDAGVYVSRTKAAYWDGKNEAGEEVSSGIYFYSISAGDFSATKKMIIRK